MLCDGSIREGAGLFPDEYSIPSALSRCAHHSMSNCIAVNQRDCRTICFTLVLWLASAVSGAAQTRWS
jgi:hypothetical protein